MVVGEPTRRPCDRASSATRKSLQAERLPRLAISTAKVWRREARVLDGDKPIHAKAFSQLARCVQRSLTRSAQ